MFAFKSVVLICAISCSQVLAENSQELNSTDALSTGSGLSQPFSQRDVIITTRSTLLGTVAQWFQATMTVFCDGDSTPAIQFFDCLHNRTHIPELWAAMGLNATTIQVQTIQTTSFSGQQAVVDANSLLTLLNNNVKELRDLLGNIQQQLVPFCSNTDDLMVCMEPFIEDCVSGQSPSAFGASINSSVADSDNTTIDAPFTASNSSSRSMNETRALDDDDNEKDDLVWINSNLPLLTSPDQALQFFRTSFDSLCANQAAGISTLVENLPCMFNAMGNISCGDQIDSAEDASDDPTASPERMCRTVENMGGCYLANVQQACQKPEVSQILSQLGADYLNISGCAEHELVADNATNSSTLPLIVSVPSQPVAVVNVTSLA